VCKAGQAGREKVFVRARPRRLIRGHVRAKTHSNPARLVHGLSGRIHILQLHASSEQPVFSYLFRRIAAEEIRRRKRFWLFPCSCKIASRPDKPGGKKSLSTEITPIRKKLIDKL
jgi:hypothetical protein